MSMDGNRRGRNAAIRPARAALRSRSLYAPLCHYGLNLLGTYRICKDGKLLVWEAERLWRLSSGLPVRTVPLSSIANFDDVCWFHSGAKPTCRAVASHAKRIYEADLARPIILSARGTMMDGMHRVAKAWLLGMQEIKAVQFSEDPPPDRILPMPRRRAADPRR